jgi:HEPN domain-containing protein
MNKQEIIEYWVISSNEDYEVMNSLLEKNHYPWTLFVGHLVLEKLLKAYYVQQINNEAPRTHDLTNIAALSQLDLTEEQKDFLDEVTTFHIKARYPDYKSRFSKKATKDFTEKYIEKIGEFRLWLKKKIAQ